MRKVRQHTEKTTKNKIPTSKKEKKIATKKKRGEVRRIKTEKKNLLYPCLKIIQRNFPKTQINNP